MASSFSLFCVPSGLTTWDSCSDWWLDDANILCLLIWQMTFLFHLWRQNCNHLPGQLNQGSCVLGEIRRRIPKSMETWKPVRRASLRAVQDAFSPLSSSTWLSSRLWVRVLWPLSLPSSLLHQALPRTNSVLHLHPQIELGPWSQVQKR